jgi:NADH dehydrogenase [ubiquinone] 1 alpha subcomplex assembly factor 4
MGKALSSLAATATAPLRNYNIEQRVQKVISQNKPKPAPKYESDKQELERIMRGKCGVILRFYE